LNDETGRLLLDVGCLLDFSPSGIVRLVQSLGLCFYPHLKCLKRFIVLLPGAAVRIAEDLRTRAGLSFSYDADRQSAESIGFQMTHIGQHSIQCQLL
jgi:hypothetical protein